MNKPIKPKITLAILTWKAPITLRASIESFLPIKEFFDEIIVVCQESDEREIKICEEFSFKAICLKENVGIQNGMKECFAAAKNEIVLFYENDLNLREEANKAIKVLSKAYDALDKNEVDFVKFRYLPGNKTLVGKEFSLYWKVNGCKVSKKLRGYLRPTKANWILGSSTLLQHTEKLDCPGFEKYSSDFLLSYSNYNKWENRAVMCSKAFFNKLISFAETHPTSRTVNGNPDLEHPINCKENRKWYQEQRFKLLIAVPGLFGHRRHDRHELDEKWGMVDPLDEGGEVQIS